MARKCLQAGALALVIPTGLILGHWVACRALAARLGNVHADRSLPRVEVSYTQWDFGAVPQGAVLHAGFPITNTGARRLIVVQQSGACCGQPAGQHVIALRPGEARKLTVQVDTSRWCGRVREVVHYTTNDPHMPRLALCVAANVTPDSNPQSKAAPDGHGPLFDSEGRTQ
jgi:hypothetical protein